MIHLSSTDPAVPRTREIQAALDRCARSGGGQVSLGPGTHCSGTLTLHGGTELHLCAGCVLRASPDPADYESKSMDGLYSGGSGAFLLQARDAEHLSVTGPGTIDGNALAYMEGWWAEPYLRAPKPWRPRGIGFHNCRHVRLRDFTFRDSASWTLHLTGCDNVEVSGLFILNRLDVPNCDGIDPDHCRNVRIQNCHIEAADDAIVLKNTREHAALGPCENVIIQGCTLVSTSAAVKLGTESAGDFRNVLVDNCVIHSSHRGLALQLRDRGKIEQVCFSNCIVETRRFHERYWGRAEPVYVTAAPRNDGDPAGEIRDVSFRNIRCRSENGVFLAGTADAPLRGIQLEDIQVELVARSRWEGGWHDYRPCHGREHGGLERGPTHGVFLRHLDGVRLRNVRARWADPPPAWAGRLFAAEELRGLDADPESLAQLRG
jgi:hypothetical protein